MMNLFAARDCQSSRRRPRPVNTSNTKKKRYHANEIFVLSPVPTIITSVLFFLSLTVGRTESKSCRTVGRTESNSCRIHRTEVQPIRRFTLSKRLHRPFTSAPSQLLSRRYDGLLSNRGGASEASHEVANQAPTSSFSLSPDQQQQQRQPEQEMNQQSIITESVSSSSPPSLSPPLEQRQVTVNQTNTSTTTSLSAASSPADTSDAKVQVLSSSTQSSSNATTEENTGGKENPRIMMLIRILFVFYYGSLGSLMPYLPVYYHSLGHGGQIIGMLGAVKPFTTFLVAPIWGAISDQTNNPFLILQLTFMVSLIGQLLVGANHNPQYIMTMVFLTAVFNAPVKSLLDSMALDHIQDRSSYGRLRLWGQLGFGLGSSSVGYLLSKSIHISWADAKASSFSASFEDILARFPMVLQRLIKFACKSWQSLTGYKMLFLAYAALSVPTFICMKAFQKLDREDRESIASSMENEKAVLDNTDGTSRDKVVVDNSVGHGLSLVLQNPDAMVFFFLVLVVGISSGVIENFAYVRIREVGGTGTEMGISRLVSSVAGAPMFWFSGPLSSKLGVDRVLVLSLLSYVSRFMIYACMRNPFHGLPAEALRGVTFAAFWSSATIYAHNVSPPGLHATMLMLLNAMYGGLGQSLGAIIGGKLQHKVGTVSAFWYAAAVDAAFVATMMVYLSLRTDSSFRDPQTIGEKRRKPEASTSPRTV